MTIRQLIHALADADDLDQPIPVVTSDEAKLGLIRFADLSTAENPRLVLMLYSCDAAVMTKAQALRVAGDDEESLQRLRDSGLMI